MATIERFLAKNGLNNNNNIISNVADPVASQDAATKNFVTNASNLSSGTVSAGVLPAFTGDVTSTAGTSVLTLSTTGVTANTYNSSGTTHVPLTIDAKGRITATGSAVTITPAWSSITSTPTTIAGYGITDAQAKDAKLTSVSALSSASTGLIKLTNGVASLDSSSYLTANQTVTVSGDATGSGTTAIALTLATVATAGTYKSVTVDVKGRVTSGTNPTTLAGYGITDAINSSLLGAVSGVATLDSGGKVPSSQLPSYVDDVLEYATSASFPGTGETGKIYVAIDTNKAYRWTGSAYLIISASPGSTDAIAEGTTNLYFTAARAQAAVTTITGNAGTSTKLATARNISATGDGTWTVSFDGSADASGTLTLATVATAGTYKSVTIDAKGRVTSGTNPTTLAGYGITDAISATWAGATTLTTAGALSATSLSTSGAINMNQGSLLSATLTTSTTSANQVLTTLSSSTYRTVKILVQCVSGTSYHSSEIIAIHDGTTVYINEYGTVYSASVLATYDMDISGGNLRLLVTPTNAVTTFKAMIISCTA